MSELRVEKYRTIAANLGPESPLPPLGTLSRVGAELQIADNVPEEDRRYIGWECRAPLLPYHVQDDYDRDRRERDLPSIVLENDILRARFLPALGGRLWSLVHKPSGRELLTCNPVFQPANLAYRNAWFSGGVEWNASPVPSHHPYTCSPLFAAALERADGTPVLRMWEWERVRRLPFQMDFALPDGSEFLYVFVRLANPHDVEVARYWWSNIAVDETPDTRVIVPADSALRFSYGKLMSLVNVPVHEGVDGTYPGRRNDAADAFYRLDEDVRRWIAAVEADGRGLVQTSTPRLRGRKLFLWGMGDGGRHWQEYLSVPGEAYIEIQAGLGRTQRETVPQPAGAEWTWTEAYGLLEGDPARLHGADWDDAIATVRDDLARRLPAEALEKEHERFLETMNTPPDRLVENGTGWGALEARRLQAAGLSPFASPGTPYPDAAIGADQAPWMALLEEGRFPESSPDAEPGKALVGVPWRDLLERAVAQPDNDHWLAWYHLGVMRFAADEVDAAREAWERSIERAPSAWAIRCLACLDRIEEKGEEAMAGYEKALSLRNDVRPLAIEACSAMLEYGQPANVIATVEGLAPALREDGRIQLLAAAARVRMGELDAAEEWLRSEPEIADVREGEILLTDLWFEIHERRLAAEAGGEVTEEIRKRARREFPPPRAIDFRMRADD